MHITFNILSLFLLLPFLLARGESDFTDCSFEQPIGTGESFYFRNLNYPERYPPNSGCRLDAISTWASEKLEVKCTIDLPRDKKGCINNRFVVITFVDNKENPTATHVHCGQKEFTVSIATPHRYARMYLEVTTSGNQTGRYSCIISNKGEKNRPTRPTRPRN